MPRHLTIEVVPCESKSAVDAMWRRNAGPGSEDDLPWLIHPAILKRVRGQTGELAVLFQEWSASLDLAALEAVQAAASAAQDRPGQGVTLVRYLAADGPAMLADLANLRTGLLEARLTSLGVDAARLTRDTQPATAPGQAERIDLVIGLDPAQLI